MSTQSAEQDEPTPRDYYDALDNSWPGFIIDYMRSGVEAGATNDEIVASLVFKTPPEPEYLEGIRAALDFIRSQS